MPESQHGLLRKSCSVATFRQALGCNCKSSKFLSIIQTALLVLSAAINAYSLLGLRRSETPAVLGQWSLVRLSFLSNLSTLRVFSLIALYHRTKQSTFLSSRAHFIQDFFLKELHSPSPRSLDSNRTNKSAFANLTEISYELFVATFSPVLFSLETRTV